MGIPTKMVWGKWFITGKAEDEVTMDARGTNNHQDKRGHIQKDFLLTSSQTTDLSIHARYPKPLVWASGSSSVDPESAASAPPGYLLEM